jgi:hypothetical protein
MSSVRPKATTTIEPLGARSAAGRAYSLKVIIEIDGSEARFADKSAVTQTVRRTLAVCAPEALEREGCTLRALTTTRKGKGGIPTTAVVAIEGAAVCPGRPAAASVAAVLAALRGEGYEASVREHRQCLEAGCSSDAVVAWDHLDDVPSGWFASSVCGRHSYRRCAACSSVFLLTSTNSSCRAPSVHCEVCGNVLVEWGSSKLWEAELVSHG